MKDLLRIVRLVSFAIKYCKNPELRPVLHKFYDECMEHINRFLDFIKSEHPEIADEMIRFIQCYYFNCYSIGKLTKDYPSPYSSADTYRTYVSRVAKQYDKYISDTKMHK